MAATRYVDKMAAINPVLSLGNNDVAPGDVRLMKVFGLKIYEEKNIAKQRWPIRTHVTSRKPCDGSK